MLTEAFRSIATATRTVFKSWRSMLLIAIVYAALLAALYAFIAVREASIAQVVATFALAIAAPLLFFILQSMIMRSIAGANDVGVGSLIKTSLASFWKLILITLPLVALAVLIAYLLAKAQAKLGSSIPETAQEIPRRLAEGARDNAKPIDWKAATGVDSALSDFWFGSTDCGDSLVAGGRERRAWPSTYADWKSSGKSLRSPLGSHLHHRIPGFRSCSRISFCFAQSPASMPGLKSFF